MRRVRIRSGPSRLQREPSAASDRRTVRKLPEPRQNQRTAHLSGGLAVLAKVGIERRERQRVLGGRFVVVDFSQPLLDAERLKEHLALGRAKGGEWVEVRWVVTPLPSLFFAVEFRRT